MPARRWRIASWVIYLAGLPPWVIIFARERNWIAAACELAGAPSMALGLLIAVRGLGSAVPKWLDHLALVLIPCGLIVSLLDFGGLTTVNQWLEIGLVTGFLVGTYLLAKEQRSGYLWFLLMHVLCGALLWIQNYRWLFWQQVFFLVFVLDAYLTYRRTQRK